MSIESVLTPAEEACLARGRVRLIQLLKGPKIDLVWSTEDGSERRLLISKYPRALATHFSGYCRNAPMRVDTNEQNHIIITGMDYYDSRELFEILYDAAWPRTKKKPTSLEQRLGISIAARKLDVKVIVDFLGPRINDLELKTPTVEEVEMCIRSTPPNTKARTFMARRVIRAVRDERMSCNDVIVKKCKAQSDINWMILKLHDGW